MSLPELQLDDLNWNELVDTIRTRIVAHSNGEWTMHAPVDPGVTLLELFAYQFEQRLYWLDQVPASFSRAILALLDDAPLPTQSARSILAFTAHTDLAPRRVPAGMLFQMLLNTHRLPMTTLEDASLLPLSYSKPNTDTALPRLSLSVDGKEHSTDLVQQRPIELLPSDGQAGECQLIVWLDRMVDQNEVDGSFNILLELETADAITPEWEPLANKQQWFARPPADGYDTAAEAGEIAGSCGLDRFPLPAITDDSDQDLAIGAITRQWALNKLTVSPPAELVWSYSTGTSGRRPFSAQQFVDGSGGLRRSGVLRIQIPGDWQPLQTPAGGPYPYALWAQCEQGSYSAPPRLRRILPNVAVAQQVQAVTPDVAILEKQLEEWLKLPAQRLQLDSHQPEPIEDSVRLTLLESDGEWRDWLPTDDFYRHGPADRVFVVDRARKQLVFGDGLTGRIPVLSVTDATRIRLCYLAGGGTEGNLARQSWQSRDDTFTAVNPVAAVGGADGETIDEAKARIAYDLQRIERAVTADNFEAIVLSTPGIAIARAHAEIGHHPDFPCRTIAGTTTVFVVPEVPRPQDSIPGEFGVLAPVVDPGALREISLQLDARRLISHEVFVRPAAYRAVFLRLILKGVMLDEARLLTDIEYQLRRYLDPLLGGPNDTGWAFGNPLRPTELSDRVRRQLGDGSALAGLSIALDQPSDFEECRDVHIGTHELVYLAGFSAEIKRTPAMQGGLR